MSHDFNLNTHIILAQPRNAYACPYRLVIGHPLSKIPHHSFQSFTVKRNMVRIDAEDLLPSFPTSVFQAEIDITECLVNLSIDFSMNDAAFGIPASYSMYQRQALV